MKDDLRYKYKIKRKYFQHSAREVADGAIADIVMQAFGYAQSFFVYYSYGSEADTHALIKRLLLAGKRVYLPKTEGKNVLAIEYNGDEDALKKNAYGILEPCGQAYDGEIDVCITPLLAVNYNGFRLGYGGGYYDRFFAEHPQILKVGIGYKLQITDDEFEEENDVPLDIFVCERGMTTFGRNV